MSDSPDQPRRSALPGLVILLISLALVGLGAWVTLTPSGRQLLGTVASPADSPSAPPVSPSPMPTGPVPTASVSVDEDWKVARTDEAQCDEALSRDGGVLVIGDSLTVGGGAHLTGRLAEAGVGVCLDAKAGRNAAEGNAILQDFIERGRVRPGALVVMAFGANDAEKPAGWGTCQVTTALNLVGPDRPLLWVNGYNETSPERSAGQDRFNEEVWQVARETSRLGVVDWHARALATPAIIAKDRVHPTVDGRKDWAELVAGGILQARDTLQRGDAVTPRCTVDPTVTISPR